MVSVLIPKAYHSNRAERRLICKVIKKTGHRSGRYRLACEYGELERNFAGKDLMEVKKSTAAQHKFNMSSSITLRAAAKQFYSK